MLSKIDFIADGRGVSGSVNIPGDQKLDSGDELVEADGFEDDVIDISGCTELSAWFIFRIDDEEFPSVAKEFLLKELMSEGDIDITEVDE